MNPALLKVRMTTLASGFGVGGTYLRGGGVVVTLVVAAAPVASPPGAGGGVEAAGTGADATEPGVGRAASAAPAAGAGAPGCGVFKPSNSLTVTNSYPCARIGSMMRAVVLYAFSVRSCIRMIAPSFTP